MEAIGTLSNDALFALVAAMAGPYLIAVINRSYWSVARKKAMVYGVCGALAAGWLYANGQFNAGDWFRMALLIAAGAQVWYRVNHTAVAALERATG